MILTTQKPNYNFVTQTNDTKFKKKF